MVFLFLGKNESRGYIVEWIAVAAVRDFGEAEIIRGMLAAQGIPIMIKDEEAARIFPGVLGNICILVPEDQVAAAKAELRSIGQLNGDDSELMEDR
jgi:hypothetical protein